MACNIFSRLFRRRQSGRQLPVSADRPSPPALPVHTDKDSLEQSLVQLELANNQEHDSLTLLGCLSEQGSYTLTLPNIPFGAHNTFLHCLQSLPGFIRLEGEVWDCPVEFDVLVHFSTAADAAQAMASQPTVNLGSDGSRRLQYSNRTTDTSERAAKRQKTEPSEPLPKCLICCEELAGPHSRPCLHCDARWCYNCLKTSFSTALEDQERFPAKCCGRIVHFDVGKGVLAEADYLKYKTRFEEHGTTKPVYCGNSVCSEFLPTRLSKPDAKGRVHCFSCQNVTCVECRVLVYPVDFETHTCTEADEMTALMTQFEYKRCPRCNTGVAKMYGCSHVRCQCGAHWCWDCQRAIQICWSKPCERAREDGDMTDDYDIPAEDSDSDDEPASETATLDQVQQPPSTEVTNTEITSPDPAQAITDQAVTEPEVEQPMVAVVEQAQVEEEHVQGGLPLSQQTDSLPVPSEDTTSGFPNIDVEALIADHTPLTLPPPLPLLEYLPPAALAPTPPAPPVQQASVISETIINLDANDQDDWEAGDFDFGDEPTDETWDTWGCLHHFERIKSSKMHQYWLPSTQDPYTLRPTKHVDCLKCYKTITITEAPAESKKDDERKDSAVDISRETPNMEVVDTTEEPEKNKKKRKKNKQQGDFPKLFNCRRCGVVYCDSCKKNTLKELNVVLDRNTFRA